jgi:hypothetical protein
MVKVDNIPDNELVSFLQQVRDNIEMNAEAGMAESYQINIQDEREIAKELDNRNIDYDDEWRPPEIKF